MLRAFSPDAPALTHFDRYARRAVCFTDASTTASWTLPAHGSLHTGLYPDAHGATDPRRRLGSGVPNLAEALRRAGYRTAAFTDGGFVHRRFGFSRGFERYDDWGESPRWPRAQLPRNGRPGKKRKHVFNRALAFLSGLEPDDSPFFLFLHTYAVHDYYLKAPGHRDNRACIQGRKTCSPAEWKRLRQQYQAELLRLDGSFGRLLAALEALPSSMGPTVLLVLSDHGEGFDVDRGRIHHGGRLHQDLVRVPLLVSGPGVIPREVGDSVSLVDVMPTILDLAGVPVPPGLDGRSFAAALRGERLAERPRFAMEHYYTWEKGERRVTAEVRQAPSSLAVIAGGRWLIRGPDGEELYDTHADVDQRLSLGPDASREPLGRLASDRLRQRKPEEASQLDEALEEQLRSLGYIE
jgi:arylsulfatase A-like enzyme